MVFFMGSIINIVVNVMLQAMHYLTWLGSNEVLILVLCKMKQNLANE